MNWSKKGLIYCPDGVVDWKNQFAMLPTPLLLSNGILRIFVGICDKNNVGRIGYVDVNPSNPSEIIEVSETPILDIGMKGAFDDNGVVPISILRHNGKVYLYYIGFQLGVNVPYYMFCGLAISEDEGKTFERYSRSPILDRINDELYARCGVNVIKHNGKFRMWYIGSYQEGWVESQGKLRPLYIMKVCESMDGIHWSKPVQCMDYKNEDEHGFGRPFVWVSDGIYKMYYSIRTYSRGYYIGYAESEDGVHWNRKDDEVGITLSQEGWDSQNISYPFLYSYNGNTYMLYNGNGCGKSGFGYAELKKDILI